MSDIYDLRNGFINGDVAAVISEDDEMPFLEWCENEGLRWCTFYEKPTEWIPSDHGGYILTGIDGSSNGVAVYLGKETENVRVLMMGFTNLQNVSSMKSVSAKEIIGWSIGTDDGTDEIITSDILGILQW